jgi:hypothetical protein
MAGQAAIAPSHLLAWLVLTAGVLSAVLAHRSEEYG